MADAAAPVCPRCGASRVGAPECPRCGVIYAKAAVRTAPAPLSPPVHLAQPPRAKSSCSDAGEEERIELIARAFAIPAALVLAAGVMTSGFLHMLARVFLSMWVHELGHAVSAWLCGFAAMPGPWRTWVAEVRGVVTPLLVLVAAGGLVWLGIRNERRSLLVAAGTVVALQIVGTFVLNLETARALTVFFGDGGCLVLGTLLMASMYAGRDTQIHKGWLRWGFLVIGAFAFMDASFTWWAARRDYGAIPFGENEGSGLSDASVLVDQFGWGERALVMRYVVLSVVCGLTLAIVYVTGVLRSRAALRSLVAR